MDWANIDNKIKMHIDTAKTEENTTATITLTMPVGADAEFSEFMVRENGDLHICVRGDNVSLGYKRWSGDAIYACRKCGKRYRLSDISMDMGDRSIFGFVWIKEKCPNCGHSELDGPVWDRIIEVPE